MLDPVGAGATPYRNRALGGLMRTGAPSVIRGNGSEIMSVAGLAAATRGVDSAAASNDAVDAARRWCRDRQAWSVSAAPTTMCWTPAGRWRAVQRPPWMTRITGVGCSATCAGWRVLRGAARCLARHRVGHGLLGVVGEVAAENVRRRRGRRRGRLQIELLDGLQLLDRDSFTSRLKLAFHA